MMKLMLVSALMGLGLMGCANLDNDSAASGNSPGIEHASATGKTPAMNTTPIAEKVAGAERPAASLQVPLTKEQCMATYPVTIGQLARRQQCVNASATESSGRLNTAQQAIISDCASKLLALAQSADSAVMALDDYKVKKQLIRTECNTAIRNAAVVPTKAVKTTSKTTKNTESKASNAKTPNTKTATTKAANPKDSPTAKVTTRSSPEKKPQPAAKTPSSR
jgi:hypothetical protein